MYRIKMLPIFTDWLTDIADTKVRGAVIARIKRLEHGLMGDASSVGGSVFELRIHIGSGWRIYFTKRDKQVIVLLGGGSKRTQEADIKSAKEKADLLD